MEKKRPTYDLPAIQAVFASPGALAITVIQSMDRKMFIKSMTTFADHRVWQDVYQVPAGDLLLYVKFQADAVTEFRVMAFKEK